MTEYLLELKGISKAFPGVRALNRVQFGLRQGEIHALMGENGAGKSTFIKVITGVYQPDEGEIFLEGKRVHFHGPSDAQKAGIAAIYQHVTAYAQLTVTENIFMGHEMRRCGLVQWKRMHTAAQKLLDELEADFDATAVMGTLSVAQQQMVEIAKALSTHARIIIMDEPTAALTKTESERLYAITEKLRRDGVSILLISHRFEDMYRLASRVTVFRDAEYIGTWPVNGIPNATLIKAMVGREISDLFPKPTVAIGAEMLRVEGLCRKGIFRDVSFAVHKGEILGLTGLVGARRTEVAQCIYGIERPSAGKIYVGGKEVHIHSPADALKNGIGLVTEDRQNLGLILEWSICHNITLPELDRYVKRGRLDTVRENADAKARAEGVDVKAGTIFDLANTLSGGNQQKVVVAKALNSDFKVIILDEPTKGVDVGSKAAIYEIMGKLVRKGYAIIMISSEMPEIIGMCDRLVVMCEGRVTGEIGREDGITQERILELAMMTQK